jgi:hypothetical protein
MQLRGALARARADEEPTSTEQAVDISPLAQADRCVGFGLGYEVSPGVASGVDDGVVGTLAPDIQL